MEAHASPAPSPSPIVSGTAATIPAAGSSTESVAGAPVGGGREVVNEWMELGASGIHGRGGFARCRIPAGTPIIEYVGERVGKEESTRRCVEGNPYIFTINEEWDIDGDVAWNPARYLNHACTPNCEAEQDEDRIWLTALRDILPGEELTFNYGYDFGEWRDYPCGCGSPKCLGYIVAEEFHEKVRAELSREIAATPSVESPVPSESSESPPTV